MSDFYEQEPGYQPDEPVSEPEMQPEKKKKSIIPWIALSVVIGIVIGAACLWGGMRIFGKTQQAMADEPAYQVEEQPVTPTLKTNTGDKTLTPAEVYQQNVGAVVGISTETTAVNVFGQKTSRAAAGSGFILTSDGYVVTNGHVVSGANTIKVTLNSGETYDAKLIGTYSASDVALLKIDATDLQCVSIGKSSDLIIGERVAAIGNPLGELTYSMTVGYVSAVDREITADGKLLNMIQTDVAINSGNSGGPLFDMNGNVVGITTAKYSGQTSSGLYIEGLSFAIPIDDVIDELMELQKNGFISGRPRLGVSLQELDANTASVYGLPVGPYVQGVEEGSCAEKAGVQKGDIILALGDTEVDTYNQLVAALNKFKAGDTTTIKIYRGGAEHTLTVTLDELIETPQETAQPEQEVQQQAPIFSIPGFDDFFGY